MPSGPTAKKPNHPTGKSSNPDPVVTSVPAPAQPAAKPTAATTAAPKPGTLPRELDLIADFPGLKTPTPEAWRALVDKDLAGAPFEKKLITHTYEGVYLKPLYTRAELPPAPAEHSGAAPFTRGASPLGLTQCGWDIRQERSEPSISGVREAMLEDLQFGVTSIILRLDAAGRAGLDPDDPKAGALVASDGCSLSDAADFDDAFDGVYLDMIGVGLEAGASFTPGAALLGALWDRRKIAPEKRRGWFNADPLAVLARDGHLPYSVETGLSLAADLAAYTSKALPAARSIRVGTAPYHHAGATATQDLAFSMATALEYLRAMAAAGLTVDAAAKQMVFSFAVGTSFFLAIAKLRAARRLWARVLEASGGTLDESTAMRMHVRTSKRVITSRDPWVNILRNTACVYAAAVAGADAIGSVPFDAALGLPSALARRVARNTHHILQSESHLHRVSDPAGGSWYLDNLTNELAEKAWVILQSIEARGGMAKALADGWVHEQIDSAYEPRAKNIALRKDAIIGVSDFPNAGEEPVRPANFALPPIRAAAIERMKSRRREGVFALAVSGTPGERSAQLFAAAKAGATIGQMSRSLWNEATGVDLKAAIAPHPFAESFENLRDASDDYAKAHGHRPRAFLASMGSPAHHLPRTNFAKNLFEAGGFELAASDGYAKAAEAVEAFKASGCDLAVICSTDALYETLVPELAPALHRAGAKTVVLAGNPGDKEAAYRTAGVDRFIFVKCDVVKVLAELLSAEGAMS